MNFKKWISIAITFIMTVAIFAASEKNHKLFNIKDINNPNLRKEMTFLADEFELDKQKIKKSYEIRINELKELRRLEIKSLKDDYSKKRDIMLAQHKGKKSNTKSNMKLKTAKKKDAKLKKKYGIN